MLVNMQYKPRILHSACASLQTGCKNAETSRKSAKTPCTDETTDLYSTQKKKYTAGISRYYQQMLSITVNNLFIRYQQNIRPGFGSIAKTAVCTQILTMQISYSIFNNAIYTYLSIAKQGCSEK